MYLRITNGFDRLSDSNLVARANNIMTGMTGNAYFPAPQPSLASVETAIDAFSNALSVAQNGSNLDKAFKNIKRDELTNLLHSLAYYVLFTANGNVLAAESSNFTIAKQPSTLPGISAATNLQLKDGMNKGELIFSFDKVHGAKSYIYQYTADPLTNSSTWQSLTGTVKKINITDLDKDKRYWCRVVAIGTKGQGVYSNAISRLVQ